MIGTGRTAMGIVQFADLGPGSVAVVPAAAGGIGTLLVQYAKNAGATVLGLAGGPEKTARVAANGADLAVDHQDPGWPAKVRAHLGAEAAGVVFDGVGGDVAREAVALLGPGGRHVVFGWSGQRLHDGTPHLVDGVSEQVLGPVMMERAGGADPVRTLGLRALAQAAEGRLVPAVQRFPPSPTRPPRTARWRTGERPGRWSRSRDVPRPEHERSVRAGQTAPIRVAGHGVRNRCGQRARGAEDGMRLRGAGHRARDALRADSWSSVRVSSTRTGDPAAPGDADPRRWWGLVVIALAQLMVVLDATIVNIALPSAQRDLDMSDGNRQWVITAYTLAFGGLLLLGGRVADLVGRKRTFVIGLVGFAAASAIGGAAVNSMMLFGARALQGVFAAVLAPSALSLLTTTFTDPKERGKAFGIYGALAGSGSAIGFIVGGVLTEYLNWRWCLYVNVPVAVVAVIGALLLLHDRPGHAGARLDVPGVILGCGGLVALVYGFSEAQPRGWTDALVLALFALAVVLLAAFVWWQTRAPMPLLPLHIIRDRDRAGCFLTMMLAVIGMFGLFLFMTYYLQVILGYSPVRTGLAFLPMTVAIIVGSTQIAARLLPHVSPRMLMVPGMLLASGGMVILTQMTVRSEYVSEILPALLLMGLGMGLTFMPVFSTATAGVAPRDSGATSATVNTSQQVGGSIGTALLNTIATSTSASWITAHLTDPSQRERVVREGVVHGYTVAIWVAAGIMLLAGLVAGLMVTAKAPKHGTPADSPVPEPVS